MIMGTQYEGWGVGFKEAGGRSRGAQISEGGQGGREKRQYSAIYEGKRVFDLQKSLDGSKSCIICCGERKEDFLF